MAATATPSCAWCGGKTHHPTGVFLARLANGRTICDGCGFYTLSCECVERPEIPTTRSRGSVITTRTDSRVRALVGIDPWLARRILAGHRPKAIAVMGGVSLRTAYRWCSTLLDVRDVEVGGYVATFAIRRDAEPIRLDDWRRA